LFVHPRNDDYCEDWYEPEEYSSQFPRAEEEMGWGIEETMYTSSLDKSKLTPEQIANAERIAAEIEVSLQNLKCKFVCYMITMFTCVIIS
jgi:hypothetical protein